MIHRNYAQFLGSEAPFFHAFECQPRKLLRLHQALSSILGAVAGPASGSERGRGGDMI